MSIRRDRFRCRGELRLPLAGGANARLLGHLVEQRDVVGWLLGADSAINLQPGRCHEYVGRPLIDTIATGELRIFVRARSIEMHMINCNAIPGFTTDMFQNREAIGHRCERGEPGREDHEIVRARALEIAEEGGLAAPARRNDIRGDEADQIHHVPAAQLTRQIEDTMKRAARERPGHVRINDEDFHGLKCIRFRQAPG